eukprot:144414_1
MAAYEATMVKVNAYLETESVKSCKSADIAHLHCDIASNEPLLPRHLLSLFFYTDFTDLCTHFSATFRRTKQFELLSLIKARNAKYWWMSKSLFELVQLYGESGQDLKHYNEDT